MSASRISPPSQETTLPAPVLDLSEAIAAITTAAQVYSESRLPPVLPTPYKRWVPEVAPPAPHDEHSYFPMTLYR
jgi:hypothetical protein